MVGGPFKTAYNAMQKAVKPLCLTHRACTDEMPVKNMTRSRTQKNARLGKPGIFNYIRCKVHHCPDHGIDYTLRDVSMITMVIPKMMIVLPAKGLADWPVAHLNPQS